MRPCIVALALLLAGAVPASAAPITADWTITNGSTLDFDFTLSVEETAGDQYEVLFTVTNDGDLTGYYRGFGVKHLFDDEISWLVNEQTSLSVFFNGIELSADLFLGGLNLKTSQSDYCKDGDNGHDGMVCAEFSTAGTNAIEMTTGDSLVFLFEVTGADLNLDYWHLQTKIFSGATGTGALGSISADSTPSTSVPEPGTLALLGIGIAAAGVRRRPSTV